ncbi:hypothetical protein E4U09_000579 [Claviceps aff. purpurea]|uniref:Uncharacterized protein n=1 Tax=Claviceps aff. purpurea TaxID=1967640 RepID=A0A9P7U2F0_9HYPO|nr:hypothetical protein E4U09_000579 [Claviceps aff. purpurea]
MSSARHPAKLEAAHLDNSKSRQGSPPKTPDPGTWMPDSFDAIGITDNEIRRCLADFNKMYKDSDKYPPPVRGHCTKPTHLVV